MVIRRFLGKENISFQPFGIKLMTILAITTKCKDNTRPTNLERLYDDT